MLNSGPVARMADGVVADVAFAIGHRHRQCEDYALAGVGPGGAFVVVSDGCSSSRHSDHGARLLTAAAARQLSEGCLCTHRVVQAAAGAARLVGLPAEALDATLLCAYQRGTTVQVTVSGDGVVAAIDEGGALSTWSVRHPSGAPAYLSYHLDAARQSAYLDRHRAREVHTTIGAGATTVTDIALDRAPYLWRLELDALRYPLVAILSDGAESFHADDGVAVPLREALRSLLDFKVVRGAFVERRLRRFLGRECPSRGWRHDDDLAIGALVNPYFERRPR